MNFKYLKGKLIGWFDIKKNRRWSCADFQRLIITFVLGTFDGLYPLCKGQNHTASTRIEQEIASGISLFNR